MKFTVAFRHHHTTLLFVIKKEKDEIYIALPKWKQRKGDNIFLTKSGSRWVGDTADKKLVEKLGCEIDAVGKQKPRPKRKPA